MLKRELAIFLVVGLLTVAVDFAIYRTLIYSNLLGSNVFNLAKGLGFIGGAILAYFANRFLTFNQQTTGKGRIVRFILVYLLGLAANIVVNYLSSHYLNPIAVMPEYILLIVFLLATGVSATLNFIGMKFFVFTDRRHTAH